MGRERPLERDKRLEDMEWGECQTWQNLDPQQDCNLTGDFIHRGQKLLNTISTVFAFISNPQLLHIVLPSATAIIKFFHLIFYWKAALAFKDVLCDRCWSILLDRWQHQWSEDAIYLQTLATQGDKVTVPKNMLILSQDIWFTLRCLVFGRPRWWK